jgi:predicted ATPase
MLILTYRPEFEAPWVGQAHTTLMTLNRLDRRQCAEIVDDISRGIDLVDEIIDDIAERTDGIPLFVEELTKAVIEASGGGRNAADIEVPATLQDSLEARLDRLGSAKEIAQIGAVIGRSFDYDLLLRVAELEDDVLVSELDALVKSGLAGVQGSPPTATYTFKHALVQDTAYGSLLRGRRSELHELVARTLEHDFLETSQSAPEILAHHFTEAGLTDRAVDYWKRAGELAARRFANAEAIEHLTRAINLLHSLPDEQQSPERELEILTALFAPTGTLKGYIHADTEENYVRALELCERIGDTPLVFPALFGSFSLNMGLGQTSKCLEIGQTFLSRARSYGDDTNQMVGHRLVGTALLNSGDPSHALEHLDRVVDMYDSNRHENLGIEYQIDPKVAGLSQSALSLWILGYPERALKRRDQAVILGERLGQPVSKVYASVFCGCMLSALLRDRSEVGSYAKSALSITEDFGVVSWATFGRYFSVWMDAEALIAANALSTLDEEMVGCRKLNPGYQGLLMGLHAEVLDKAGEHEKAIAILDSAEIYQDQGGDRLYAAELSRIRGQVALNEADDAPGAEQSFKKAITIAQSQSAKSWELRSTTSLARLWRDHGKASEAHELLASVYDWFTEGFDTADLKEAQTLLEELS